jgi:hypothetical protein
MKQGLPQFLLQLLYLMADRGLRQIQFFCSTGKMPETGCRFKASQQA